MKKRLWIILAIALLSLLLLGTASADAATSGQCGDDLEWSFDETTGTLTITGSGEMKNYYWYSDVPWYNYRASITTVVLPEGLTSIGGYAFYGCSSLTEITIPDSVKSIGDDAFYQCTGLTSVRLSSGLESIDFRAFYGCTGLTEIEFPAGLESIGASAFEGCMSLASFFVPNSVTEIGVKAFYNTAWWNA